MTSVLLPLLSLGAGMASLFLDRESQKRKLLMWVLAILLLSTFTLQIISNSIERAESAAEIEWSKKHITHLTTLLKEFRDGTYQEFANLAEMLHGFGWASPQIPDLATVQRSLKANEQRTRLVEETLGYLSGSISVEYLPKDVDGPVVEAALRELGFAVLLGEPHVHDTPTNAIWFGTQVELRDVKLVALTLVRAGVDIKVIRPFRSTTRSPNLIQVGADMLYEVAPPLAVEAIAGATAFDRWE